MFTQMVSRQSAKMASPTVVLMYTKTFEQGVAKGRAVEFDANARDLMPTPEIQISDDRVLIASLRRTGKNIVIQSDDPDSDLQNFYLGPAVRVGKTRVKFASFDGLGIWSERHCAILFKEITRIQFETPYINAFSRNDGDCPFSIPLAD